MAARFRQWKIDGVRVDRSERQCSLDQSGVQNYPPPDQWTDQVLKALIAKATPEQRYRATQQFLKDPRDTGTPTGTVRLLAGLFRGEILSKDSTGRLISILQSTATFPHRLKGLLPAGTVVAHKTGSIGGTVNDVGIINLPDDAGHVILALFVKEGSKSEK